MMCTVIGRPFLQNDLGQVLIPIHFKTWSMQKEHIAAVEGVYFLNTEHDIAYESSHSQPVVDELAAAIEEHDMPTVFYTHTYESSPN
jgi:hypothetical protein